MAWDISPIVDAVPEPVGIGWSFPGTTPDEWRARHLSGLDEEGRFHPNLGCFLVRRNGLTILCDTGIGPGPNSYLGGLKGQLPQVLAAMGVRLDEIDAVIFTHLHMDHIGWTTSLDDHGNRVATFPNATHFVAEAEFAYWGGDPGDARPHHKQAFETAFRPLAPLGKLVMVTPGEAIMPDVSLIPTPGHTPHHCSIRFADASGALVVAGDIFHCPGQVERPEWQHRADMDPDQARATRRVFIDRAAGEGWLVAAGHFRTGLQLGNIIAQDGGFRFSPRPS